ncbi:MAG: DUF4136 domain-containing protein [Cyclobacteriaceae bacterium]
MYKILLIALVFFASCASVKVRSDQAVDFDKYETFYCMECLDEFSQVAPEYDNPETRELIRESIITELEKKGLTYTEENPQMLVDFKVIIEERTAILTSPETTYYYWETYDAPTVYFKQGTLLINLIDASNNQAIWQGASSRIMDDDPSEKMEERVKSTIARMFKKFN